MQSIFCSQSGCLNKIEHGSNFCKDHIVHKYKKSKRPKIHKANRESIKLYRQAVIKEALITGIMYGKPIIEQIYTRYKKSATHRELSFDISIDDFKELWQKPCSYCGEEILTIGVDRVDNDFGYTKNNIVPCCTQCNLSKRAMSAEEYILRCMRVAEYTKR